MNAIVSLQNGFVDWPTIDWQQANKIVSNLRGRIFRAAAAGDLRKVRQLQKLLLRSTANIVLAVRRVTQVNRGRHTAGIDKVIVKTAAERGKLSSELMDLTPWKAKPVKRVWIPKAKGRRPLGIPVIRDRALQAMVKSALEPFWEARFEGSTYGFRSGRSCHDAIGRLYTIVQPHKPKKVALDADLRGAFDHLDHHFLLRAIGNFPARELIKQWLKAGVMEEGRFRDSVTGAPQGGVVSPLLMNIALHGMEAALGVTFDAYGRSTGKRVVVKYADDFVVLCESEQDAREAKAILTTWLQERGLAFSEEKTKIVHLREGFNFLGFNFRHYPQPNSARSGYKLLIKPSKETVVKMRKKLREAWKGTVGKPTVAVIRHLNPIITGWGNYFRIGVAKEIFKALDQYQFTQQVKYAQRRHPKKMWHWKRKRYWGRVEGRKDQWVFKDLDTGAFLWKFSWLPIERHIIVKQTASPDDPTLKDYWAKRRSKTRAGGTQYRRLFDKQKGICPVCKTHLENGEAIHKHHLRPRASGGSNADTNLRLVHELCHQQLHSKSGPAAASKLLEPDAA